MDEWELVELPSILEKSEIYLNSHAVVVIGVR